MFKKGQQVQFIGSWDEKGTIFIKPAIVHSCGKKQMVLHHADTGEFLGSNFKPEYAPNPTHATVISALPKAETEAFALELGERFLAYQVEHYESRLSSYGADPQTSTHYLDKMLEGRAAAIVAAPSVLWKGGAK